MLGYIPAIFLQCVGVLIPILGIIVLLKKGQGKENTFLVMANFGAMVMNWGYMEMLRSTDYQAAFSVYKFEYIGSVMFYLFFVLFLKSFFTRGKKLKYFAVFFILFVAVEAGALFAVLLDSPLAYKTVTIQFRQDDGKFYTNGVGSIVKKKGDMEILMSPGLQAEDIVMGDAPEEELTSGDEEAGDGTSETEEIGRGYTAVSVTHGDILLIRYSLLAIILLLMLAYTFVLLFKRKVKEERRKIMYLAVAECGVFISLLISIFGNSIFNMSPLLVSCSVMGIICGTASGNFFTVADLGREWVLDHSDVIFIIVDTEYHLLDANDYAKKVFPVLGSLHICSLLPEDLKESFLSERDDFEIDGHIYAKRMAPIEVKGKTIGYSILFMDVTSHYELMEQLEAQTQKAIAANEAKSNFMSNMSHEIRTPMNAIVGMTEIMLRREQDAFNTEYLSNIKNSGNALLSVVNDILDFSKIESGKLEIIPDEYEIMSVLNDLSMIFLNRIGEKPVELIYDIDPALPVKLYGDSNRIRQVLLNIVNNGIKYTDEGHVKLLLEAELLSEDEIRLNCAVEDTGIGIKEEDLPRLFSTFSQVDTKKNRGKEGTGLGLSIAKQLVEAMGGSFTVESEYGKGSTFRFSMVQKVVDRTQAARIKDAKPVYVTGRMSYEANYAILKKLCAAFEQVQFVEPQDVLTEKVSQLDYVFVDRDTLCRASLSDEEKQIMDRYDPEFITLQNPMKDSCNQAPGTHMNKPLYTLNFCLAINHEVLNFQMKDEKLMSFTAPEARILIVDDNEMNRKVAAGLLEPIGMTIDMAVDGKRAVEMVQANSYDLVMMDHMMPVMDGIEATAAIRAMDSDYYKNLPIIALSANALVEAREQFKNAGMNDFLAKPIKTKSLFAIVKKYLPKQKIIEGTEQLKDISVSRDDLPVIEGLDVPAGVENSGGLELFISLLGDFYKLIDRKATKIEKCMADQLLRDFTIEVHALKNTARMIGALELSEQFYELEKAGNAENLEYIDQHLDATLQKYCSYKEILRPYAAVDTEGKEELSGEALRETITELRAAIDGFDLDTADAAMKKLESSNVPEQYRSRIEDLAAFVADVAMEDVMELCDRLLEEL